MEQLKDALEYLVELGKKENLLIEDGRDIYARKGELEKIYPDYPTALDTSTLTSIVDYIKINPDDRDLMIIKVNSHASVSIYGSLDNYEKREKLVVSNALIPEVMRYGTYYSAEEFNIALLSRFVPTSDLEKLVKIAGNIEEAAIKTSVDDGMSQQVTLRTGITSVGNAVVPNKVKLKPFRTFTEIEQPESEFIFRVKEGPSMAIFEADGGAWKNKAILDIKVYLEEELINQLDKVVILA